MTRLDDNHASKRKHPLSVYGWLPADYPLPNSPPNPKPESKPDPTQSQIVPIFFENDYLRAHDKGDLSRFIAAYDPSTRQNPADPATPFPFQFPLPQIGRITMADRFPDIGDVDLGKTRLKSQGAQI
jgi:hypothetical protein